jgi:peptide/nickel transport system substrate-binding protein/oligopeptide transport system substrate-binding protein
MDLSKILDSGSIQVTKPIFATNYLYVRSDRKPWNDPDLRRALALLLPWEQMREVTEYHLVPADSLIPPIQGYPKITGIAKQDAAKAKELLAASGHKDGSGLPELRLMLTDGEDHKALAATLSQAWQAAGIKVRVEAVPGARYFDSLKSGEYDVASMSWIGDFSDPMTFLQMWTSDSNLNDAKYADKEYDKLVKRSMSEEGSARMKTLSEAERVLLDSGSCMPIFHSISVNVISTDTVGGWYNNPLDVHPFKFLNFTSSPPVQGVVMAPPSSLFLSGFPGILARK